MAKEQTKETKTQSKKNTFIGCGILTVIVIILAVVLGACATGEPTEPTEPIDTGPPVSYPTVVYEITGSAEYVDVLLNGPTRLGGEVGVAGNRLQFLEVPVPVTYTYEDFDENYIYISAQNQGGSGTVTVTVYIDGELWKTKTTSNPYGFVSVSGGI